MKHIKTQLNIKEHSLVSMPDNENEYYSKFQNLGRELGLPESPAEYEFINNIKIPIEKGSKIGGITPDFKVTGKNIVIEIDGADFHTEKEDKKRDDIFFKNRHFVIRISASALHNDPELVCDFVRRLVVNDLLIPYQVEYINKTLLESPHSILEREMIIVKQAK